MRANPSVAANSEEEASGASESKPAHRAEEAKTKTKVGHVDSEKLTDRIVRIAISVISPKSMEIRQPCNHAPRIDLTRLF